MRDCGQFWQDFLDTTRLSLENSKVGCFMVASNMDTVSVVVKSCNLTLRRLMSYIYMEHPFLMFLDHTQRRSTVGRTPLDE